MRIGAFLVLVCMSMGCGGERPKVEIKDDAVKEVTVFSAKSVEVEGELNKVPFTANRATLRDGILYIEKADRADGILSKMEFQVWIPEALRHQAEISITVNSKQTWTEGVPTVVVASRPIGEVPCKILHDGYDLALKLTAENNQLTGTVDLRIDGSGTWVKGRFGPTLVEAKPK